MVSSMLQEKYGINLNNIKETPTFKTLLNTQVLIFESLAKVAPRGSVIKECLNDMSEMLKSKNGVEAIDVNNGIRFLFTESGYDDLYEEATVTSTFSLNESLVEDRDEFVAMIVDELILEKKDKKKKKKEPSEAEEESDAMEEEESSMTTKELMDTLSELEQSLEGPEDLEEI